MKKLEMKQFDSYEDMLLYLHNNEGKTKEREYALNDITFVDAGKSTISVSYPDGVLDIRKTAYRSVFDRCGLAGIVLNKLPVAYLVSLLNTAKEYMRTNGKANRVKCISVGDQLIAMLSSTQTAGNNSYERQAMDDTLSIINDGVETLAEPSSFIGFAGLEASVCRWSLETNGRPVRITMSSSNIGEGALSLRADSIDNGKIIPITKNISIQHRMGEKPNPGEIISSLVASIDKAYADIDGMKATRIHNPELVVETLRKQFHLDIRPCEKAISALQDQTDVTAYDVYSTLSDTSFYEYGHKNGMLQEKYTAKYIPILGIDWQKYDD